MKTINKILRMLLVIIFCASCFSCTTITSGYRSDEYEKFRSELNKKAPITGFENFFYEDTYIFAFLETRTHEGYFIGFYIFQKSSDISKFEIDHILLTDEFGSILFEDVNVSFENTEMYKSSKMYQEYFRFNCWIKPKERLLESEITDKFYNVSMMIDGKTTNTTLKRREWIGINWPT